MARNLTSSFQGGTQYSERINRGTQSTTLLRIKLSLNGRSALVDMLISILILMSSNFPIVHRNIIPCMLHVFSSVKM